MSDVVIVQLVMSPRGVVLTSQYPAVTKPVGITPLRWGETNKSLANSTVKPQSSKQPP